MQRRSPFVALGRLAALGLPLAVACSPAPFKPPHVAGLEGVSPLGPSYVLLPLPGEDEALLGRVLFEVPPPGRSLEETSRPNPCLDALAPPVTSPLASTFEDAQELAVSASARATLGVFGFDADASKASHFLYKISTEKRVARADTTAYVKCCEKAECGVGYVSALVHGDGEYATGEESGASGSIAVPTASVGGAVQLKVLHKRNVRGYIAALVTMTGKQAAAALGPLGAIAGEATMPERVRAAYEREKVSITTLPDGTYVLANGFSVLTENDFARKYDAATSTSELESVDRRRNWGSLITAGLFTAGFGALTIWGATHLKRDCAANDVSCWASNPDEKKAPPDGGTCVSPVPSCIDYIPKGKKTTSVGGILALAGGGALTLSMLPFFVLTVVNHDGQATSHALSEDDARAYVTRYNRVMLRRASERVQREMTIERGASIEWKPMVGLGTIGAFASF